jgi:hypothetical protein
MYEIMNTNSKIIKNIRRKTPRIRNSVGYNPLNLTIPRKTNFSGHFHLITPHLLGDWLIIVVATN